MLRPTEFRLFEGITQFIDAKLRFLNLHRNGYIIRKKRANNFIQLFLLDAHKLGEKKKRMNSVSMMWCCFEKLFHVMDCGWKATIISHTSTFMFNVALAEFTKKRKEKQKLWLVIHHTEWVCHQDDMMMNFDGCRGRLLSTATSKHVYYCKFIFIVFNVFGHVVLGFRRT